MACITDGLVSRYSGLCMLVKLLLTDVYKRQIYGSVSGKKSDEDGKALGSAVIGIFNTGTTEFTKENAIAATTSKDDGSFSFVKVPMELV